jgi:hypothetical protein
MAVAGEAPQVCPRVEVRRERSVARLEECRLWQIQRYSQCIWWIVAVVESNSNYGSELTHQRTREMVALIDDHENQSAVVSDRAEQIFVWVPSIENENLSKAKVMTKREDLIYPAPFPELPARLA